MSIMNIISGNSAQNKGEAYMYETNIISFRKLQT